MLCPCRDDHARPGRQAYALDADGEDLVSPVDPPYHGGRARPGRQAYALDEDGGDQASPSDFCLEPSLRFSQFKLEQRKHCSHSQAFLQGLGAVGSLCWRINRTTLDCMLSLRASIFIDGT